MNAKQLSNYLKNFDAKTKVGIVINRPDGDDFYEFEAKDFAFIKDTTEGDELPFRCLSLGSFNGTLDEIEAEHEVSERIRREDGDV